MRADACAQARINPMVEMSMREWEREMVCATAHSVDSLQFMKINIIELKWSHENVRFDYKSLRFELGQFCSE